MYLSFQKYTELGGTLTEVQFNHALFKAEMNVDVTTSNRIKYDFTQNIEITYKTNLEMLMFELVGLSHRILLNNSSNQVSSESNEGMSRSFVVKTDSDIVRQQSELILTYLDGFKNSASKYLTCTGVY